jgi:hypothetical protein
LVLDGADWPYQYSLGFFRYVKPRVGGSVILNVVSLAAQQARNLAATSPPVNPGGLLDVVEVSAWNYDGDALH